MTKAPIANHSSQCNTVDLSVFTKTDALEQKFHQKMADYHRAHKEWDIAQVDMLEDPTDEVAHDFDLFIKKRFLTNGEPDRTKSKEPVTLRWGWGWVCKEDELVEHIGKVLGLTYHSSPVTTIIG